MMLANYHTHTVRCKHAVGSEREYIEAAIANGFKILGFSDHTPWPYPEGVTSGISATAGLLYVPIVISSTPRTAMNKKEQTGWQKYINFILYN